MTETVRRLTRLCDWLGHEIVLDLESEYLRDHQDLDFLTYFPLWLRKEKKLTAAAEIAFFESTELRLLSLAKTEGRIKVSQSLTVDSRKPLTKGGASFVVIDHPEASSVLGVPQGLHVLWWDDSLQKIRTHLLNQTEAHLLDLLNEGEDLTVLSDELKISLNFLRSLGLLG